MLQATADRQFLSVEYDLSGIEANVRQYPLGKRRPAGPGLFHDRPTLSFLAIETDILMGPDLVASGRARLADVPW